MRPQNNGPHATAARPFTTRHFGYTGSLTSGAGPRPRTSSSRTVRS